MFLLREHQTRERGVLKFTQIAQLIIETHFGITLPPERLIKLAAGDPGASPLGGHRPYRWVEVAGVEPLGFREQLQRRVEISVVLLKVCRSDAPPVRVLREPCPFPKFPALQQVLLRR